MNKTNYVSLIDNLFGYNLLHDSLTSSYHVVDSFNNFDKTKDYHFETTEDSFILELPVPGLDKNSISVKVIEGKLKIEGGVTDHRWSPEFKRSFILPKNVNTKNIKATIENGVLIVTIGINKESETIVKVM
jgi:HSP20 family molecular chaperone IbpA